MIQVAGLSCLKAVRQLMAVVCAGVQTEQKTDQVGTQLITWSRISLEEPIVSHLVKKLPIVYET
jgi:hypothetical protein